MKKVMFSVFAVAALFVSLSLTSCTKEKDIPLVKQVQKKSTYQLKRVTYNGNDITQAAMRRAFTAPSATGIMELHINEPGASAGNIATSAIKTEGATNNDETHFDATAASDDDVILSFETGYPTYAAEQDKAYLVPQSLIDQTVFGWANGNYVVFYSNCLSGSYKVTKNGDTFLLTQKKAGKEVVMELGEIK